MSAVRTLTNGELQYDKDGILGLEGKRFIDNEFVEKFVELDYFSLPPPKTTGRELFSESMRKSIVEKLKNRGLIESAIIATITRVTAESIARAYEQFVTPRTPRKRLDEIYLCGGGAYNPNIVDHLKERFPEARITLINELSPISATSKEATAFAILGYLCLHGMHTSVPSTVESAEPVVMGSITPGSNFHRLISSLKLKNGKFLRSIIFV
jgi:1,6-anhydro-N-acetylmuramate kinase